MSHSIPPTRRSLFGISYDVLQPYLKDLNPYLLMAFLGCWLGGVFDGLDSSLMHVTMPLALKDLTGQEPKDVAQLGAIITSVFLVGWTLGGTLFGVIGDKYGRIKAMMGSILLYSIFTGLGGLAHSWQELAAYRFLTGLGIGGELVSITTFLTEIWPERSRAFAVALLISSYQIGQMLAGGLNYFIHDWRYAFFVGAAPAVLVFFLRRNMQESEKWMEAQCEQAETQQAKTSFLKLLFEPANRRGLLVGSISFSAYLTLFWAGLAWIPSWLDTLPNHPVDVRQIQTVIQGVFAIVGCCLAGWLTHTWGRKPTLVLGTVGILLSSLALFLGFKVFHPALYLVGGCFGFFHGVTQSAFYVYIPELFPTRVRMSAVGFCFNSGRLFTAAAVLMVGTLVQYFGGFAGSALTFSLSGGAIILLSLAFAKETRGTSLRR
jgi:MFS family permease